MQRNEALAALAAILTTIRDLERESGREGEYCPEGPLYMALGCTLDEFHTIVHIMEQSHLISRRHHTLSLTPLGREKADAIIAATSPERN